MSFEHYVVSSGKRLRCGYTTGSCAALAAYAATKMLLTGKDVRSVTIRTPKGLPVTADILEPTRTPQKVRCAVQKDAGDDCDCTDGALIFASAELNPEQGVFIDGGPGVGRVTKPGLDQPVGAAAINSTPRRMIAGAVQEVCDEVSYTGGIRITIDIPQGEELAQKTFNQGLGIVGGLSILGTSGIVEPQSLQALVDTIETEMKMLAAGGHKRVIVTPGNYGQDFLEKYPLLVQVPVVKCANFIGASLDLAAVYGFGQVLLVGHIGKMVKIAGSIMDTHSRVADCRTELFAAHAALCGADRQTVEGIMCAATADACIELLLQGGIWPQTLAGLLQASQNALNRRSGGAFEVGMLTFSNRFGLLGQTDQAQSMIKEWENNK